MIKLLAMIAIGIGIGFLVGCSNGPYMIPDSTDNSNAAGAALNNDIFYRKPMQDHRKDKQWEFYYKHCELDDEGRPFVSKRSYACTDAF
jgi:hypothetical protein